MQEVDPFDKMNQREYHLQVVYLHNGLKLYHQPLVFILFAQA